MSKELTLKILFISCLFFIILLLIVFTFYLQYLSDNKDICLDTSVCKEGLEVNTEYGLVKINKENCIKYNWKWMENSKMCNMQ